MTSKNQKLFLIAGLLFAFFVLFTVAVLTIDVQPIGPRQSRVGFATLNGFVFNKLGSNLFWYQITDWLGLVAVAVAFGFAGFGLGQLIRNKSLARVDKNIIALGFFYILTLAAYAFFEIFIVNYRPIELNGVLEASYPSSHTMAMLCVMVTAMLQFRSRIISKKLRLALNIPLLAICLVTIVGRLLSGVHWLTDILGALLLSAALIMFYYAAVQQLNARKPLPDASL